MPVEQPRELLRVAVQVGPVARVLGRAVERAQPSGGRRESALHGQLAQPGDVLRLEHLARPFERRVAHALARDGGASEVERDALVGRAERAQQPLFADPVDGLVRGRPVPDQVAEAHHLLRAGPAHRLEGGVQRDQVRVHVADQAEDHEAPLSGSAPAAPARR